ncbi:MAG: hypothetical protein ACKOTZ_00295 [Chloroflexota bacterium]
MPMDHRVHIPEWARYVAGLWVGDVLEVRVLGPGEIALRWAPTPAPDDPSTPVPPRFPRHPGWERDL